MTDLGNAFVRFLKWLVTLVIETAAQHGRRDEQPYYDAKGSPMGKTAFLRLARENAFPTYRAGKKLLAKRADVDAWIQSQKIARPRTPRPPPGARAVPPVDVNALSPAEAHELAMGRDPKQGPTTERSPRPRGR
ncbi:hypothetical protein [Polyangium spumosum]|uniref:Helix-turn-helix domain-containing protein n=1 Tax=Polyangium spumosum TaxID=889282 RepID=A0A6N7Q6L3_9BACT|nr:hypothetical protein [Polyangium spumosum]MRG98550.1 hypothetical protein [Polyangium spumosum]